MALASLSDLAGWMGVAEADLPDDADRLLDRASEMVRYAITKPAFDEAGDPLDELDAEEKQAITDATCAQGEYLIEVGEHRDLGDDVQSFQLGDLQITYGAGPNREAGRALAPRARRVLSTAGLIGRGVAIW